MQLKGNIGFGGGGNTLYAVLYVYEGVQYQTDIGGLTLGGGAGLTLAPDPAHGNNAFYDTGTFTINKGGVLNIDETATISDGGAGGGAGLISMTDPSAVIAGTPGGGEFQAYDELVLFSASIVGVGIVTGMDVENTVSGSIIASGGTLILSAGTDSIVNGGINFPDRIVSDGYLGANAGSDLVIMGTLALSPNIIDGSSPGGGLSGAGTITLGGSIITGAAAGTIEGGTLQAGLDLVVSAPGGGLDGRRKRRHHRGERRCVADADGLCPGTGEQRHDPAGRLGGRGR